ncbi:nucleoside deaminase [Calidifontibacter terrae]
MDWSAEALDRAVDAAAASAAVGGVPVGSCLTLNGKVIAVGHNQRVQQGDPTAHGEIDALRAAGRSTAYGRMTIYTTLAPCAMCSGAIVQFGIPHVVVGENTTFPGELDWLRSRGVEVTLVDDPRCRQLMSNFQRDFPRVWAEDIGEGD